MEVTIKYGIGNSRTKQVETTATVGEVISDSNLQAELGYDSDAVRAIVGGVAVESGFQLSAGDTVSLEDKASEKAA